MQVVIGKSELPPVVRQDREDGFWVEWFVVVGEANLAANLGVAGELPVDAGIPIRITPISERSKRLGPVAGRGFPPLCLVYDQQLVGGPVSADPSQIGSQSGWDRRCQSVLGNSTR